MTPDEIQQLQTERAELRRALEQSTVEIEGLEACLARSVHEVTLLRAELAKYQEPRP